MMRKIASLVILITILLISCKNKSSKTKESTESNKAIYSFLSKEFIENYTYRNETNSIELKNGKLKTNYENYSIVAFDVGDVNKDNIKDLFILLKNNTQGSGTFYFTNLFVGNLNEELEFIGEKFIGDRINPNYISIYKKNQKHPLTGINIHPNDYGTFSLGYYMHSSDQPFSEEPRMFMTPEWKLVNGKMTRITN